MYDTQEEQILLNRIDIPKYKYNDYMNISTTVYQEFRLICQPVGANVAGKMEYDRKRVYKACVYAGFGDRLATMEKGLDTMLHKDLSDDGIDVSGGEAQKVTITRALYKDAPLIILDKPTAALNPIDEAEIYGKFDEIAGDKTAIYISHRLSSCKFCDEIMCSMRALLFSKALTLRSLPTQMANTTSCGAHRRSIIQNTPNSRISLQIKRTAIN